MPPPGNRKTNAEVERIWLTMRMTWGRAFDRNWSPPPGLEGQAAADYLKMSKEHWAHELREFTTDSLRYALSNLPDQPCTLPEFKSICRRAPSRRPKDDRSAAQAPPNPAVAAAAKEALHAAKKTNYDTLKTQRDHMHQELAGLRITIRQREFWRIALRAEIHQRFSIDTLSPSFCIKQLQEAMKSE